MRSKWSLVIAGALFSTFAFAQGRSDFKPDRARGPDLVRESEQLQLIKEPLVQSKAAVSDRSYSLGLGRYDAHFIKVDTEVSQTRYDLSDPTSMVQLSYAQLPWVFEGRFGWQADVAYGFQELKTAGEKTTLHIVPISIELIYRGRLSDKQLWAPQLGAGGGMMSYYQRGEAGSNTSGSNLFAVVSASVWFGVGEWLDPKSIAPMDVTLSYDRIFGESTAARDMAGQAWFLSMGVSL